MQDKDRNITTEKGKQTLTEGTNSDSDDITASTNNCFGNYDNLAIEGGGVLGVAYLGALGEMYKDGSIMQITNFAGASVGSLVALFLAARAEYNFLYNTIMNLDFRQFKDSTWLGGDLYRVFKRFGFYKGDKLLAFLQTTVNTITGLDDPTFMDIYKKYGTSLIVTGTNVTKCNLVYFTKETQPDMSVCLACRLSSSIPYFFQSLQYKGDYYVDGGTLDNYPIDFFNNNPNYPSDKTIGLKLISEVTIQEEKGTLSQISGIEDFTSRLIDTTRNQALKIHVKNTDWERTIKINTGTVSYIDFNLSQTDKEYLVKQGLSGITNFKSMLNNLN